MLCASLDSDHSRISLCKAWIGALRNNLRIAHTILRFITVVLKVRTYIIVAGSRIQMLRSCMPYQTKILWRLPELTDLTMHGYVYSRPALWILGSSGVRVGCPRLKQGDCQLYTCYTCTWLDSLAGPHLLESARKSITHSANPSFAQRSPWMVRIRTFQTHETNQQKVCKGDSNQTLQPQGFSHYVLLSSS